VLRQLIESNKITALVMEKKFQLKQPSRTLERARPGPEELRQLSHHILAARKTEAGDTCRK
jgi:hypothetical protein